VAVPPCVLQIQPARLCTWEMLCFKLIGGRILWFRFSWLYSVTLLHSVYLLVVNYIVTAIVSYSEVMTRRMNTVYCVGIIGRKWSWPVWSHWRRLWLEELRRNHRNIECREQSPSNNFRMWLRRFNALLTDRTYVVSCYIGVLVLLLWALSVIQIS
jgi:hypothetical protein